MLKSSNLFYLLISENVDEVKEGEGSRLQNELASVLIALTRQDNQLVSGSV